MRTRRWFGAHGSVGTLLSWIIAVSLPLVACDGSGAEAPQEQGAVLTPPSPTGPQIGIEFPSATDASGSLVVVEPDRARGLTVADVLREDERFTVFRQLTEQTLTTAPGTPTWLEVWDRPQIGIEGGVTVFLPTDEAFSKLDPLVREALAEGTLINAERYWLIGHHYVERLFPSSEFEDGSVGSWEGDVQMTTDPLAYGGHLILETDLRVANGYIHVIDGVVVPELVLEAVGA